MRLRCGVAGAELLQGLPRQAGDDPLEGHYQASVCVLLGGGGGLKGAIRNGACACVGGALKGTTRRACGGRALKGTTRRACVRERERECVCVCVSGGDEVHTRTTSHKGGAAEALVAT